MSTIYSGDILEPLDSDSPVAVVSRVVHVAPHLGLAAVMPLDGKNCRNRLPRKLRLNVLETALQNKFIRKTLFELPRLMMRDDKDLTDSQKEKRDVRYGVIEELVTPRNLEIILYAPSYSSDRGTLIKTHAIQQKVELTDLYRKLSRYFYYGSIPNAFLRDDPVKRKHSDKVPHVARGRRRVRLVNGRMEAYEPKLLTPEDITNFVWARDTYVNKAKAQAYAHREMLRVKYNVGFTEKDGHLEPILVEESMRPSLKQFNYWLKSQNDMLDIKRMQVGEKAWGKDFRATLGSASAETYGAGHRSQTDTTFFKNGSLVSSYDRSVLIGPPIAMIVMDVRTETITGLHSSVETVKYNFARVAQYNTVCDKPEYCKRFGITIDPDEWPCNVLARTTAFDAGELFTADGRRGFVKGLKCWIERNEGGRPDWRGLVEGTFGVYKGKIYVLDAGLARRAAAGRGAPSPVKGACLTPDEFNAVLIYLALLWNKTHDVSHLMTPAMIAAGIEPVPISLWKFSLEHENGHPYRPPAALVNAHLLPRTTASVQGDGIHVNGLKYSSSKAISKKWYERGRMGTFNVEAGFDPDNPSAVEIFDEKGDYFDRGTLLDPFARYAHRCLVDILQYAEHEKTIKDRLQATTQQVTASTNSHINSIVNKARVLTNAATKGRGHSRGKPSPEARKAEQIRQAILTGDIWKSTVSQGAGVTKTVKPEASATAIAEERELALLYGGDGDKR